MQLPRHLFLLRSGVETLADALRRLADTHVAEPDVYETARILAALDDRQAAGLEPLVARYPLRADEPADLLPPVHGEGTLLVDLHDVHTLAAWVDMAYSIVGQGARALRDDDLRDLCDQGVADMVRHLRWMRGRINQAAAQTLVLG